MSSSSTRRPKRLLAAYAAQLTCTMHNVSRPDIIFQLPQMPLAEDKMLRRATLPLVFSCRQSGRMPTSSQGAEDFSNREVCVTLTAADSILTLFAPLAISKCLKQIADACDLNLPTHQRLVARDQARREQEAVTHIMRRPYHRRRATCSILCSTSSRIDLFMNGQRSRGSLVKHHVPHFPIDCSPASTAHVRHSRPASPIIIDLTSNCTHR